MEGKESKAWQEGLVFDIANEYFADVAMDIEERQRALEQEEPAVEVIDLEGANMDADNKVAYKKGKNREGWL